MIYALSEVTQETVGIAKKASKQRMSRYALCVVKFRNCPYVEFLVEQTAMRSPRCTLAGCIGTLS
jgi:hypothetical protein